MFGRVRQISAREEAGRSARAAAIVRGGGMVVVVGEQGQFGVGHGRPPLVRTNNESWIRWINPSPITWSPDLGNGNSSSHGQSTNALWTLSVMATLQSKGSIISRTSFQALDIEEPESEEEPEVVELQQAE